MRTFAFLAALLLAGSMFVLAQSTPPSDTLGADHNTQRPGSVSRSDAQQNQRSTNTTGTTTGNEQQPSYAGQSIHSTVAAQSTSGAKGQQGKTAATAARRRSHNQTQSAYDSTQNGSASTAKKAHTAKRPTRRKQTTQQASAPRQ